MFNIIQNLSWKLMNSKSIKNKTKTAKGKLKRRKFPEKKDYNEFDTKLVSSRIEQQHLYICHSDLWSWKKYQTNREKNSSLMKLNDFDTILRNFQPKIKRNVDKMFNSSIYTFITRLI